MANKSDKWTEHKSLLIRTPDFQNTKPKICKKICGFDLDHTLVDQKSGKKFPSDENDWKTV